MKRLGLKFLFGTLLAVVGVFARDTSDAKDVKERRKR
jgi:hypothetical protein